MLLQVYEDLEAAAQYCEAGLPGLASEVEEALGEALEDLQVRFGTVQILGFRV
jgi:hypothetical protein